MRRLLITAATLMQLAIASASGASRDSARVDGVATWRLYRMDETEQIKMSYMFSLHQFAQGWKIVIKPAEAKMQAPSVGAASDGLDTYQFLDNGYLAGVTAKIAGRQVTNSLTRIGSVCRGSFPSDSTKELQVIWLTFLFGKDREAEMVPDPIELKGITYHSLRNAKLNVEVDSVGALKTLEYRSLGEIVQGGKQISLETPLADGYTLWRLQVAARTNVSSGTWPLICRYEQYLPITRTNLLRQWVCDVIVTNVNSEDAALSEARRLPEVQDESLVVFDYRFSELGKPASGRPTELTMYYINNGRWLGRDEAETYYKGHKAVRKDAVSDKVSGNRRQVVLALMALLTISAGTIVWRKTKQQQTN